MTTERPSIEERRMCCEKSKNILGIEPVAEAAKTIIEKSFNGLGVFLETVFRPGLEEFGYLIKDQVRQWRLSNALRVMDKAKGRLGFENNELQILANARVGLSILEECSMVDDEELQEMWAGLFASSCSVDGMDDSNMIFVDLLRRISSVEARILKYGCVHCRKEIYPSGLIVPSETIEVSLEKLEEITGITDVNRLDRELDHMASLSLLSDGLFTPGAGFRISRPDLTAIITPSALALNLFYKTNSVNRTPKDFWGDQLEEHQEDTNETGS